MECVCTQPKIEQPETMNVFSLRGGLGHPNVLERSFGFALQTLRQPVEDVGSLVHPTALLNLPYDLPGNSQLTANRIDRLALDKKRAADLRNRLHNQHPNLGFQESWKPLWTLSRGSPIGCRSPRKGGPYSMPKLNSSRRQDSPCTLDPRFLRITPGWDCYKIGTRCPTINPCPIIKSMIA